MKETLIEKFKIAYKEEFGLRKYNKTLQKCANSNSLKKLLTISVQKQVAPNYLDYVYAMNGIPYFMFSSGNTLALGAISALEIWNETVNKERQLLISNEEINITAYKIIKKCIETKLDSAWLKDFISEE